MSELRKHLQAAREEYRKERYPGDLAAEILPARRGIAPAVWWITPLAAIAATVAMIVWLQQAPEIPLVPAGDNPLAVAPESSGEMIFASSDEDEETPASYLAIDDVPSLPADWWVDDSNPVAPSFEEISSPQMPSMPTFDFTASSEETT